MWKLLQTCKVQTETNRQTPALCFLVLTDDGIRLQETCVKQHWAVNTRSCQEDFDINTVPIDNDMKAYFKSVISQPKANVCDMQEPSRADLHKQMNAYMDIFRQNIFRQDI